MTTPLLLMFVNQAVRKRKGNVRKCNVQISATKKHDVENLFTL